MKRITIADLRKSSIRPDIGDLVECQIRVDGEEKIIWVETVYDQGTGKCEGCFGDVEFGVDDDGDEAITYCAEMPSGCNAAKAIYKPACDVSRVILAVHKLEGK